jgi:DNA invertase Pin-like site-specific DNA recombinase
MKIGYARTSTDDQTTALQLAVLEIKPIPPKM